MAYVISLLRRPDRLASFRQVWASLGEPYPLTVIDAIDGRSLDVYGALRPTIHPWNFDNLDEKTLRGVVGCALSHKKTWEKFVGSDADQALIFEDDARALPAAALFLPRIVSQSENADLVSLSDWDRSPRWHRRRNIIEARVRRVLLSPALKHWDAATERTNEAYLISRPYAQTILARWTLTGAIDECMRSWVSEHQDNAYFASPPLFTQKNRKDSDIR